MVLFFLILFLYIIFFMFYILFDKFTDILIDLFKDKK